jgi:N-formylglutamate deformylase
MSFREQACPAVKPSPLNKPMMKKIILHIPHSSTLIPFYDGYLVNKTKLEEEQLLLTDWYTDELFEHENAIAVIAPFSRIFCDVERFTDDSREMMSKVGMGVLYETRDDGSTLRKATPDLRARIINEYYRPHHQKLVKTVDSQLRQCGKALIIDCHSFPDIPLSRDLNQDQGRPDYNIGTDNYHTPGNLIQTAQTFFFERNLSVWVNAPYSGSIVPMEYYNKNGNVQTIMLEINRRLYLEPNSNIRSANYHKVKETVNAFIDEIYQSFIMAAQ